ncbi:MAG: tail fiber domain-containing protein, partial [Candidatus Moraniibacteriota bacterium]
SHNQAQLLIEGRESNGDGRDRAVLSLMDVSPGANGARWMIHTVGTAQGPTAAYDSGSFAINRGRGYKGQNNATGITMSPETMFVGIGIERPTAKLDVRGSAKATQWLTTSDVRTKKDIVTLDHSLEKIAALRGVSFKWDDENISRDTQIGLVAQEVEPQFPEAVTTGKDGIKSLNYPVLVAPLIESVKELKKENEQLKVRIEALEKR